MLQLFYHVSWELFYLHNLLIEKVFEEYSNQDNLRSIPSKIVEMFSYPQPFCDVSLSQFATDLNILSLLFKHWIKI
jgi:hypothetical protein